MNLDWIRETRQALGLSQSKLSALSNTSLPTIQNIEAGKGNPSASVLSSIAKALGYKLSVEAEGTDWQYLASAGVPVSEPPKAKPVIRIDELSRAISISLRNPLNEREREALQAFLVAIQANYPTTFRKHFNTPLVRSFLPERTSGRLVKLMRIAEARISVYL